MKPAGLPITVYFNDTGDIILYAEFLKGQTAIINEVDFVETVTKNNKEMDIFDGDVFSTHENFCLSREYGEVIIAHDDCYRRLLYTKGKGYVRKGKPDFDDGKYNSHVLTGKDKFWYIGNIYADPSFLIDKGTSE